MIPQFLRFYRGYTVDSMLKEYARTFFALCNSMYQIQATEMIDDGTIAMLPSLDDKERRKVFKNLRETSDGLDKLIEQARAIKR